VLVTAASGGSLLFDQYAPLLFLNRKTEKPAEASFFPVDRENYKLGKLELYSISKKPESRFFPALTSQNEIRIV
jgi:hypothetical protein